MAKIATSTVSTILATAAAASLGTLVFSVVGFPAAPLTGSAVAVSVAALARLPMEVPTPIRNAGLLVLGLGIGAGVTPEVVRNLAEWPLSLGVLAVAMVVTVLAGSWMMRRVFGFDRASAILAATPGHLTYVMGFAVDRQLDVPRIVVPQAMRVLLLTVALPPILVAWGETDTPALPMAERMDWAHLGALAALAGLIGLWLMRLHVPAALLLSGMTVSAVGHGSGMTPGALPGWMTLAAFMMLGALIGARFRGVSLRLFVASIGAGIALTLLACLIALCAALLAAPVLGHPPRLLLIAYAPGGVEAMSAMAVQLGLAPAFVAAHHVARLLLLTALVPALMARR